MTTAIAKAKKSEDSYYASKGKEAQIFQDDALSFLRNLPDNSIDLIVTDPAYSGMNQMLQLGRGKIIGTYKNKGKNSSKWFEEFHDTPENYYEFLSECLRAYFDELLEVNQDPEIDEKSCIV